MSTFHVDDGDLLRMEKVLGALNKKAIPFAIKAALNATVYDAAGRMRNEIRKDFILRNSYTTRSMVYEAVPKSERNVNRMKACAGSMQEYMGQQEEGFSKRTRGKHGIPIPTGDAAGTPGAVPRRKPVKKAHYLSKVKIVKPTVKGGRWASKEQEIVRTAQEAVNKGPRFTFMTINNRVGLWKVTGGRKGVKRGYPAGVMFRLLYNAGSPYIKVKSRQWLSPAAARAAEGLPDRYRYELNAQLDRLVKQHDLGKGVGRAVDRLTPVDAPMAGEQMDLFR